jgi:F-type H+-transporting ATPase subunit epsilon
MLRLEIITVEGTVFDDNVNMVIAPGSEGVLGILPRHTPLLTSLNYGELEIKKDGEPDQFFAIGGGFMEVRPFNITVLADAAERADEIDIERAKAARERAQARLAAAANDQQDFSRAEAALQRSIARLKVAERRKNNNDRRRPPTEFG